MPRDLTITGASNGTTQITPAQTDPNIAYNTAGTTVDGYVTPAQLNAITGSIHLQATRDIASTSSTTLTSTYFLEAGRNVNAASNANITAQSIALTAASTNIPGFAPDGGMSISSTLDARTGSVSLNAGTGGISDLGAIMTATGLTVATTGAARLSGVLSGTGNFVQNGTGTTTLSAANTYTGGTTLNAGTLSLAQGENGQVTALGGGAVTLNAGTLEFAADSSFFTNSIIVASGATATIGSATNTGVNLDGMLTLSDNSTLVIGNATTDNGGIGNYSSFTANVASTSKFEIGGGVLFDRYGKFGQITSQAALTTIDAGATIQFSGDNDIVRSLAGTGTLRRIGGGSTTTIEGTAAAGFGGVIGGGQAVVFTTGSGTGRSVLTGANTYTGSTTVSSGTLQIGDGTSAGNAGRIGQNGNAYSNIATTGGTLAFDRTDAGYSYGGIVTGSGTVNQVGSGTTILMGANGTGAGQGQFDGTANVTAGILSVNGTFGDTRNLATATVNVGDGSTANSGTLHGSGTIDAKVNVAKGGTISAGNSPGVLTTGSLTLDSGSTFLEELAGSTPATPATAGAGYDQIIVQGDVNLGSATLTAAALNNFIPSAGQTYTIINNDGTDAVQGTFAGLAEGSTVTVGGVALTISYRGGDGNDVTLTDPVPQSGGGGGSSGPSTTPTSGPDSLTGTSGADTIAALAGDDTINGVSGNDLILGNQGNDSISDGDGNSTIAGGMDNDRITVGNGSNLLYGNEGADTIQAGNGGNTIVGGQDSTDGADLITSGSGNDLIFGNGGDDTVAAGGGADTVVGGYGRDIILGNQGDDILLGNQGDDTLYGGQGADTLVGGMGNDVLYGNEGDDVLYGNEGLNTFVFATGDSDFRSGTSTGDTVMDFVTGMSRIDFASGPVGTASDFASGSTAAQDFASAQAVAQGLLSSTVSYAFVSNGTDGYLFTTGGTGTAITDAVKLAGAGAAGAVKFTDIAHGALA